jgi:hypothetical protein
MKDLFNNDSLPLPEVICIAKGTTRNVVETSQNYQDGYTAQYVEYNSFNEFDYQ